jgi:RNA polymerase primary sigma factor
MAKKEFLTKDRELELGTFIQKRAAALIELEISTDLTAVQRESLGRDVRIGESAVNELVNSNVGLVYDQARKFKGRFPGAPDLEDLIQEGMVGLMTAVHKYDPARGNKFSTVAFYWISQAIGRGVNKTGRLVRLPENRIADYTKIVRIQNKYDYLNLSKPDMEELVSKETGLTYEEISNIRNAALFHSSLNRKMGGESDGSSRELMDMVAENTHSAATEVEAEISMVHNELADCMASLSPMAQRVVASQFALPMENGAYVTPSQLRITDGLTSTMYRKILTEALDTLRGQLSGKSIALNDFLTNG